MAIVVALAAAAPAGSIQAQPAIPAAQAPTPEQQAGLFADSASVALRTGDFDTAIDLFGKAYKAVPLPVYLFNVAQAHRKKAEALHGKDPRTAAEARDTARAYYRRFLDTHPADEELELKARGLRARLDDQWAAEHPREEAARLAEEARQREAAMRAEQARLAEERRKQRAQDDKVRSAVTRAVVESDRSKARVLELSGGAAIGAGLVSTGVGIYLGLQANKLGDDLTHDDVYDRSRIARGNQYERDMAIAYAAGGALVVGGAIAFWLGHRVKQRAEAGALVLTVAPTAQGGEIILGGSY